MGCCCSCCCCKPDVEPSLDHLSLTSSPGRAKTPPVGPVSSIVPAANRSVPDELPPPYEIQEAHADLIEPSSPQLKDLPYYIPLTSSNNPRDSLAAAYAEDLQPSISEERFLTFLDGLDKGLFASQLAEPGTASAYIQSIFQERGWQTSQGAIERSADYVAQQNIDLFQPRNLRVEIVTTDVMKRRIEAASNAEVLRQEGQSRLAQIEGKRYAEELELQRKLQTAKTINKQQKAMQKFLEKDNKCNRKALKAIAKIERAAESSQSAESRQPAESSSDGIYWLVIARFEATRPATST